MPSRRLGAGVVERGALEKRCASNRTGGSNPSPTAILSINILRLLGGNLVNHPNYSLAARPNCWA